MSLAEYTVHAIEITGLDVPRQRVERIVRSAKLLQRELGARAARRYVSETVREMERVAVIAWLAENR